MFAEHCIPILEKKKGYSEKDIISTCEKASGTVIKRFFDKYVYGTEDFEIPLNRMLELY
jgi:predicted metalloprotease with PDZ domain